MDVPLWIVDIRHRAAHNHLPPLDMFKKASDYLRQWLWDKYWSKEVHEAMKWAMPKKAFQEEQILNRIAKKKEPAFDLIVKFNKWRNENNNIVVTKENIKLIPIMVELDQFITQYPEYVFPLLYDINYVHF